MESFGARKAVLERKFAHDEELKFKAMARRNRLLGYWAAEKLGLSGADADAYAREVVKADFEEPAMRTSSARSGPISMPRTSRRRTIRSAAPWRSCWSRQRSRSSRRRAEAALPC
jgi:hypothetical protein